MWKVLGWIDQELTIQYSTENLYSTGILGMAKFKGASSQKTITQKTYVQRKAIFVIKRSGSQLTKEDTLGQKGACLGVAEI